MIKPFVYSEISQESVETEQPLVDRKYLDDVTLVTLTPDQKAWRDNGILVKKSLIPPELIDRYEKVWLKENATESVRFGGWPDCTPYMRHPEIKDLGLYPPMMQKMKELIGEDMGMHLNLTGWVSTERRFHADWYLNPPNVGGHYIAVWIALDDIDPRSGPFQYVPGSHKWPVMRQELLFRYLAPEVQTNAAWPSLTQNQVAEACEEEIVRRSAQVVSYLPKKGDVLFWHANLIHQGSKPLTPGMLRKSFIAHYSSLKHRIDMPIHAEHSPGCHFFILNDLVPV